MVPRSGLRMSLPFDRRLPVPVLRTFRIQTSSGRPLFDESTPMLGLAPKAANESAGLLEQLREDAVAVLVATHDVFSPQGVRHARRDHERGRLVQTLSTAEVVHRTSNESTWTMCRSRPL